LNIIVTLKCGLEISVAVSHVTLSDVHRLNDDDTQPPAVTEAKA